ncbi:MAG: RNA polymerase sporulation sigma factor SigK [Candidatus Scatomorpha sp.]
MLVLLAGAFMMLLSSAFLMLRLGPASGSFPRPLSPEEERKYVDLWLEGDIEARNVLIEHNLRLVAHIIKKYYTQADDADDLISIGTIGLIKGINTYRPEKGVRLATYASRCCENEILMYFRALKKSSGDISLSESIDVDGDGNTLSLMDIISQEDDMAERIGDNETCMRLREYVDTVLTEREAEIIRLRYGLRGAKPLTQRETATLCGISRSYVSRIEKKALEKLREALGDDI